MILRSESPRCALELPGMSMVLSSINHEAWARLGTDEIDLLLERSVSGLTEGFKRGGRGLSIGRSVRSDQAGAFTRRRGLNECIFLLIFKVGMQLILLNSPLCHRSTKNTVPS